MEGFSFWQRWLIVYSLVILILGIFMAFFSGTILFEAFNNQVNPVFWDTDVTTNTKLFQQWIFGVLGSAMTGWGIFMVFIAHYPFKSKEIWSRNCLIIGLLVWFVMDTAITLYFNVYFNAVFNSGLFILGILPLIFTWKHFVQ